MAAKASLRVEVCVNNNHYYFLILIVLLGALSQQFLRSILASFLFQELALETLDSESLLRCQRKVDYINTRQYSHSVFPCWLHVCIALQLRSHEIETSGLV